MVRANEEQVRAWATLWGILCWGYGGTAVVLLWWWQSLLSHVLRLVVSSPLAAVSENAPLGTLSPVSSLGCPGSWLPSSSALLSPLILVKHILSSLLRSMQRHKREFWDLVYLKKKIFFFAFSYLTVWLGIQLEVEDNFLQNFEGIVTLLSCVQCC